MSKRAPLSFNAEKVIPVAPTPETRLPTNTQTSNPVNDKTNKRATNQTKLRANNAAAKHENDEASIRANSKTDIGANTQARKSRMGRQFIAAHILPEAAKQFKLLAVQSDKTTQELLVDAINDLFTKHGLSRIAD
jgi:hypothetical protein